MIEEASQYILLITPYVQVERRVQTIAENKLKQSNISLLVVCRGQKLDNKSKFWLNSNEKIKCIFIENLHAKCYLNDKEAILTSMNLYTYSMVNNIEFGIVVNKDDEPLEYRKIFNECRSLLPEQENVHLSKIQAIAKVVFTANEFFSPHRDGTVDPA